MSADANEITRLLAAWNGGDEAALEQITPIVYRELRRIAAAYLRRERPNHTLQPTALVNEAFVQLIGHADVSWQNRAHFFAVAARMMRRLLVDHARGLGRAKRGGGARRVPLDDALVFAPEQSDEFLALDQALERLAAAHPRQAQVVELRFFGGLSVEETAAVLKVSPNTVIRDWRFARAWLHRDIEKAQR